MADKAIITASITGAMHIPTQSEYLPITPEQIADEAVRSYEAGAAVAHIHVRDPKNGRPISDIDLFRKVSQSVRDRCNIVLCQTTGGHASMSLEERIKPMLELRPELASCNSGSMNFSIHPLLKKFKEFKHDWEQGYLEMSEDMIFSNTFKGIRYYVESMYKQDTKPEFEVYDVGQINNLAFMTNEGIVKKPIYLQFILGVLGGIPASVVNLSFMVETARKAIGEFEWSACIAGKDQIPIGTVALVMGGNVRVGLEDNLYLQKGVKAKSNAELVAKICHIASELGIETATPDEVREILGLKGINNVNY